MPSNSVAMSIIKDKKLRKRSSFLSFPYEFSVFFILAEYLRQELSSITQFGIWQHYVRYPFDDDTNDWLTTMSQSTSQKVLSDPMPHIDDYIYLVMKSPAGRLCCACTGEGKRRVFAIGNYINQRLLYPFHQWLASVLRLIPMDGTFDQTAPLDRLAGSPGTAYSIDLKAATDRWPFTLMACMTASLFGEEFATAATEYTLRHNTF